MKVPVEKEDVSGKVRKEDVEVDRNEPKGTTECRSVCYALCSRGDRMASRHCFSIVLGVPSNSLCLAVPTPWANSLHSPSFSSGRSAVFPCLFSRTLHDSCQYRVV